jgi:threonine/homoserine/homoserine lactone efflux protein
VLETLPAFLPVADAPAPPPAAALRVGLVTSLANPKLAVFFG